MKERWIHPRASEGPDSGRKQARNWERISSSHRPSKEPRLDYVRGFYASVSKRPSTPRDVGLGHSRRRGLNALWLRKRTAEPPPNTESQLLPDLSCKERSLAARSPRRAEHRGPKEPVCATVWFLRGSRGPRRGPAVHPPSDHAPQPRVRCWNRKKRGTHAVTPHPASVTPQGPTGRVTEWNTREPQNRTLSGKGRHGCHSTYARPDAAPAGWQSAAEDPGPFRAFRVVTSTGAPGESWLGAGVAGDRPCPRFPSSVGNKHLVAILYYIILQYIGLAVIIFHASFILYYFKFMIYFVVVFLKRLNID